MERTIRVLIVDDEPLARERIAALLEKEKDCRIVAQCATGQEALDIIHREMIDVMFLDVQMPEMDGFAVLKEIPEGRNPFIIFSTAYDEYAVKAFDVNALDYLLKPFDRKRFAASLQRVRSVLGSSHSGYHKEQHAESLRTVSRKELFPHRLVIKTSGKIVLIDVSAISWIESNANYVQLHCGKETIQTRDTLANISSRLDPKKFLRIHRSMIVDILRVKEVQPWLHDDYIVVLNDGTRLSIGRTYKKEILDVFRGAL